MKKINKHFYLYEDTINGIKKYADKNKMKASDVVEMLWTEFKAKKAGEYENKKLQEERKDENSIGADLKQISENLKQIEEVLKKK